MIGNALKDSISGDQRNDQRRLEHRCQKLTMESVGVAPARDDEKVA